MYVSVFVVLIVYVSCVSVCAFACFLYVCYPVCVNLSVIK